MKLKPVFFLVCKDDALLERWIERNAKGLDEMSILRGEELSWKDLYEEGKSFSLFSPRRLIVVKNAGKIDNGGEDLFLNYLSAPNPGVFFLLSDESLPSGKVFDAIKARKLLAELRKPTGKGLIRWIEEEIRRWGKKASGDVIQLLAERFSSDLEVMDTEIEKLVLYVGEREEITVEDVHDVSSTFLEGSPFELLDSVLNGDGFKFIKALERAFILKEPPAKVISMLSKYIRLMLFLSLDPQLEGEILKEFHPFFGKRIKKGALSYAPRSLSLSYKRLATVDDLLKRGNRNPYSLILWAMTPLFKKRENSAPGGGL
ncbi:MAG: DNA polymerase III subunit delta [Synergistetes bacterium]|nr:DNA polymerase III subunit delta [Synergistota bacterium]